ncbi:hypothetical protein HRI_001466700 [Hibiscus trionum]|uniref:Uncharacterized protein n=1 Tax=Hibiscus trionum TaxID=183268 RepID=A0A9W7LUR2_HIBTR|nr:hypothetical protein HRI_001466700 [Hibiscus trionum]
MRGSEKKIYFSSPPIKSSTSRNDENDRPNQQMGLNLQKPVKQTVKNFMSPTVSAASKVSFPRKKILGERNGSNSFITHFSKSPVLDSNPSPKIISQKNSPNLDPKEPSSRKTPLSYSSRDGTPSPGPYDPLKNFLSPRPQFLRYNPDRRKEILLRLEIEGKEGDDSAAESDEADTVSSDNSSSSSQEDEEFGAESESLLEEEDEEFDTESEEEGDEEASWSLRGVLKCFLWSVVLLLSTLYISSMNSPVSAPAFEVPTLGFQNHSFRIAEGFEAGCKFLDGKEEQLGLLSFTQTMAGGVIEEEMTENANSGHLVSLELENTIVESEEFAENIELQEIEETEIKEIEDESVKIELQEMEETEEQIEETGVVVEEELLGGVLEIEQQGQQTAEEIEFLQVDHQASLLSESSEEIREADEDIHKETSDTNMVQVLIMQIRNGMGSAVSVLEKWGKPIALNFQEPLNWLNQHMGTEMFLKVMFGFSTCAAIVASFVFGFSIRRKGIASKPSSSVDKHSTEPVAKEKPSLPLPAEIDETKKLAIPNTMSLVTASAVGSRAPSVELLAEFNIGGISRSVKSSAINSRMKDQVSSYSYFSEKDLGSKKDQEVSSELSAVNSNSSERSTSTAKKKRLGKELGSNNDAITPVRRSARIRNRADVVSP